MRSKYRKVFVETVQVNRVSKFSKNISLTRFSLPAAFRYKHKLTIYGKKHCLLAFQVVLKTQFHHFFINQKNVNGWERDRQLVKKTEISQPVFSRSRKWSVNDNFCQVKQITCYSIKWTNYCYIGMERCYRQLFKFVDN